MKYIKLVVLFAFLSVFLPKEAFSQKEIFVKQIEFELTRISDIDYENEYFLTLKLTKGTKYVFSIINGINDKPGDAILELLEADNLILTNVFNEKYFTTVNFQCNKTGFYDILLMFKDNMLGHCQIDITMIQ